MKKNQRFEEFAKHYAKDGGKVIFSECGICGHLEWSSTYTKEPPEVVVTPLTHQCPKCAEAYSRSPEIVNWIGLKPGVVITEKMIRDAIYYAYQNGLTDGHQ